MIMESLSERLEALAKPFLEEMDVELVDLQIRRYRQDFTIQILADKKKGGITLQECSELNRKIGEALEKENIISQYYVLEVSSPGVDRPLRTPRDFSRNIGRAVKIFLTEPVEERIEHEGIIQKVEEDFVTIKNETREIVISIAKVNRAKQII